MIAYVAEQGESEIHLAEVYFHSLRNTDLSAQLRLRQKALEKI